ncbi:alpha/beta fold hydrolase [Celeribacter indicus]|uniref:Putative arylesterase n=1 Tax=Celeribacter indicus TaxID=1208324 RepID=A0A0B5E1U0_9RHOB|nr:alpha/beta hydrolase [Celeribacter indicus]AJE46432.1 putative arylesterase [Celeribacter indicus]SDW56550.1 Pimeloyl-ACP methyl ester carboxylesterase [Celeribacter indicus]
MDGSFSVTDVEVNGVKLHVEQKGTGRPVVLIHGWPLSAAAWAPQVDALAEAGFRVVAYDRRGFGRSGKPFDGYDYDTLADDLAGLMEAMELEDVTLVGFSMGGGEVARYVGSEGNARLHSIVFASAVPPYLMRTEDNPNGPLSEEEAQGMERDLREDRDAFFADFARKFYTAGEDLAVPEAELETAVELSRQSDRKAALDCMEAFGTTDFRADLQNVRVPTLVLHGDADGIVPLEGSGARTHRAIAGSRLHVIEGAPHGCNVSHAEEFNAVLTDFLSR